MAPLTMFHSRLKGVKSVFSSCEVRLLIERARKNAEMAPFNSNGGANEETLTLDLFLGKEAL